MLIEARVLGGLTDPDPIEAEAVWAMRAALRRFARELQRVSVRLLPVHGGYVCRVRAWRTQGRALVVQGKATTIRDAIQRAASATKWVLSQRIPLPAPEESESPLGGNRSRNRARAIVRAQTGTQQLRRAARSPGPLLLVLSDSEFPVAGPDWAVLLARATNRALHILRVLCSRGSTSAPGAAAENLHDKHRAITLARQTRAWCDDILPHTLPAENLRVTIGDFFEQVTAAAAELEAELVVLSGATGPAARFATSIAQATRCAVVVAREQPSKCMFLAATDLEDDRYPVLCRAAELGERMHASVVAFHNVDASFVHAAARPLARGGAWKQLWTDIQRRRLEIAADRLLRDGEVHIATESDPASAIIARARYIDADTILVGIRARSRRGRPDSMNVASKVVERTDRSVIVVPLGEPNVSPHAE